MTTSKKSQQDFGSATLYTLTNTNKLCVELCSIGASIVRVLCPDANKTLANIALSYKSTSALYASGSCAGATVGPVAGRLRDGVLHIAEKTFQLTQNDGQNTLHGGLHGLAQAQWDVKARGKDFVTFGCHLPDKLDGFPGNRHVFVRYTLSDKNCLRIDYFAQTDRPTFLNLTNHTYWNLSGNFSKTAYAQALEIAADNVHYNDTMHLPTHIQSVQGTAFDFTSPRSLQAAMDADSSNLQLKNANGYNNAFLLRPNAKFAARLTDPISGRRITIHTDYPALVLYSGGYLPMPGCALALEAQYAPNSCEPVLLPEQPYQHTISFVFDTIETRPTFTRAFSHDAVLFK